MRGGRLSCALTVVILCANSAAAQSIAVGDTTRVAEPTVEYKPPPSPRFAHDDFFLKYNAAFAAYTYRLEGNWPGAVGMTGEALSYRLPGVGYKSSGAHHEPGEFNWLGGDGTSIGFLSDRNAAGTELLGYPPSGSIDPITLPPFGDTLYLLTAPLLNNTPVTLTSWRDPYLPDSTEAIARHTNGPDGFAHTGGRFRADIGRGWEFDGTGFRTFSDGQQSNTQFDGHSLDVEMRRSFGHYPMRLRFAQNRGNRFDALRWQSDARRAHLFYVLSDVRFEVARQDSAGEWLLGLAMHYDDQKQDTALVRQHRKWFSRSYTLSLSRLWEGSSAKWLTGSVTQQSAAEVLGVEDQLHGELSGGVWRQVGRLDISVTGSIWTQTDYDVLWRAACAANLTVTSTDRIILSAGRSVSAPSLIQRTWPIWSDPMSGGRADTSEVEHEIVSAAWNHVSGHLQLTLLASAGRSTDLMLWPLSGSFTGFSEPVAAQLREHRFAGVAGFAVWHPFEILKLSGSMDHTVTNEYEAGGHPDIAPDARWWAEAAFPMYVDKYNLHFTPLISTFGAARGTLPEDYGVLNVGWDFRIKQLSIFWRYNNLLDLDYRTGGAGYALDRHYMYGIRWEFWN